MKRSALGRMVAWMVIGMAGLAALGCNTVKGVGKDLKSGGEAIERAADSD